MRPAGPRGAAFTLVELLVVIAIVGALVALLLPAVQAAREQSRRARCLGNLRQIALACLAWEDVRHALPVGCDGCLAAAPNAAAGNGAPSPQGKRYHSWNAQLLPYVEQAALAARLDFAVPSDQPPNREAGATVLDLYLCPSTAEEALVSSDGKWRGQAFSDYGGVYGVEGVGRDALPGAPQLLAADSLGVLVFDEPVSLQQIEDGLSNTVSVAEALVRRRSTSEWNCGRNVFAHEGATPLNVWSGLGNDVGGPHPGGAAVAFSDGHADFLTNTMDQAAFIRLLTRAGDPFPHTPGSAP